MPSVAHNDLYQQKTCEKNEIRCLHHFIKNVNMLISNVIATRKSSTLHSMEIIPTNQDVINGRGQGLLRHPGNVKYRKLVAANKVCSIRVRCD